MSAFDRELLLRLFQAAVDAAAPGTCLAPHLPPPPRGRTVVVGAGKAAAAMARVVDAHWPADAPMSGLVVTRYHHGDGPSGRIEVVEAGHPVPDAAGRDAAARMLDLVRGLGADDLVLCLMSGGASSLLALPAAGVDLRAKQDISRALLRSGASIHEMNTVRKHLSAIKGGRLAEAAAPAQVLTLMISDVPGDDPSVIGSGPTVPDASTLAEARAVLARYGIVPPPDVAVRLADPAAETPKPGGPAFANTRTVMIATPQEALEAAAAVARRAGVTPLILGDSIEGEAAEVARVMAGVARQAATYGQPAAPPCVLLSGGETTVTVRGQGRGGRNAEFLLALAVALDGHADISAIACDTDGIDGTEDNAGALLLPDSLMRAAAAGVEPRARLADNDGYGFFAALGDLVVTGPTRTNVNDFRALLVRDPRAAGSAVAAPVGSALRRTPERSRAALPIRLHIENDRGAPAAMQVSEAQLRASLRDRLAPGDLVVSVNDEPDDMARRIGGAQVLFACRKVDLRAASAASGVLAWTQVTNAGVEPYVADLPPGMMLTNASGVHGAKGAEFILAAVLMLNFQIPAFISDKEARRWSPVFGGVVAGKTVTLLGVGGIGEPAAARLRDSGARVIGVTRTGMCAVPVERCVAIEALDSVLPETDFLVSTLPLTTTTTGLVDRARLQLLPRGAGIVVVGRAAVFDYEALMDGLRDGHLGGAVLDVFPQEPVPQDSPLWSCPRLVMTPHCSLDDHTTYMDQCLEILCDNLVRFRDGTTLRNLVDPALGY